MERQILDYLTKPPAAQATLGGIVEWWLLGQYTAESTADVAAALVKLVAKGKVRLGRGRMAWCITEAKLRRSRRILRIISRLVAGMIIAN